VAHKASQAVHTDVVLSAEQRAQAGIRLAFPGLSAARPAVVAPLAQVVDAAHRELASALPVLSLQALGQAASLVFSEIQAVLLDVSGERLEGTWRRELWDAQWQPLLALRDRGLAKRLQLDAADGHPLTVCFGKRARSTAVPPPHHSQVYPYGDGCGLVYPDSVGLRRPTFRYYCPQCGTSETGRQRNARSLAVAQLRGLEPVLTFDENGQPTPAWAGSCTSCGEDFVTTDRRVSRCNRCRAAHR
jgi:predicted RNA-binding Zn-ribbon protein involved in translation (DUF1610 family)